MQELDRFNQDCLYAHNGLRKTHGVDPLIYDKKLAIAAQNYAEKISENKSLQHSSQEERNNCGENLSQCTKSFVKFIYSGLGATVNWYSEIKDYDFNLENQIKKPTGHFTQVIWKGSKTAGFGRAKNPVNNTWYIVGRYFPAGNVKGQFKQNVPALPINLNWENVRVVEEYMEELKQWEFSKARRHILDSYSYTVSQVQNNKGFLIKETYKPIDGDIYYESQIFDTNVTQEPRPVSIDSSLIDNHNFNVTTQNKQEKEPIVNKFTTNNLPKEKNPSPMKNNDKINVESKKSDIPSLLSVNSNQSFIESLLERHNFYRQNHGVKHLVLDQNLSRNAQNWADNLCDKFYLGFSYYKFQYSEIGENIALKNGDLTNESANKLVDNWYNENEFYFYDMQINDIKEYGHFTQIVWRNTEKIGIGICTNESGFNFIVCFYYPPGNIKSDFHKMVPRLI